MKRFVARVLVVAAAAALANVPRIHAQGSALRPEFEAASIKPDNTVPDEIDNHPAAGGRLAVSYVSLKTLITIAWKVRNFEIAGLPAWADSDRYDLVAKAEGNPSQDRIALMLQSLLEDRFRLKAHRETRELPVYALTVAKNGPKLKRAADAPCAPAAPCGDFWNHLNGIEGGKVNMRELAEVLSNMRELGRTVTDNTGLTGTFYVDLNWSPADQNNAGDNAGPSIFTALQEQLGLKLESRKAPVELLVVDHAERPSEN